ncbi:hypothetical protein L209DRAFT_254433 [Thermothelomyces heterothallicus CBS 203.75]
MDSTPKLVIRIAFCVETRQAGKVGLHKGSKCGQTRQSTKKKVQCPTVLHRRRVSVSTTLRWRRGGAGRGRDRVSLTCKGNCAQIKKGRKGGPGWRSDSRFLSAAADDTASRVLVTRGVLEVPNTKRQLGLQKDSLAALFLGHMPSSSVTNQATRKLVFTWRDFT